MVYKLQSALHITAIAMESKVDLNMSLKPVVWIVKQSI